VILVLRYEGTLDRRSTTILRYGPESSGRTERDGNERASIAVTDRFRYAREMMRRFR
jgi:hypothetical protein